MTRLTNSIKDAIVDNIIKASDLPERRKILVAEGQAAAKQAVESVVPPEFAEMVRGKPREWFSAINSLSTPFRVSGSDYSYLRDHVAHELKEVRLDDPVLVPHDVVHSSNAETKYGQWLVDNHVQPWKQWEADLSALKTQTRATLAAFTTVAGLLKAVPELKQFVPAGSQSYPVPAVPVQNFVAELLKRSVELEETT